MKMIVLRDSDNDVDGYRLGNYQLLKHYYYGNFYGWELRHVNCHMRKVTQCAKVLGQIKEDLDNMLVIPVWSCKEGKNYLKLLAD